MSDKPVKAWAIVTPQDKIELDSIRDTRKKCIADYMLFNTRLRGNWKELWLTHFPDYRCVKVTVTRDEG